MPSFDGTGPLGQGPMTGRGQGFCVLKSTQENPYQVGGFAGLHGVPIGQADINYENFGMEVIKMPFGNRTGPTGLGPMTGRAAGFCAGYLVPGYMNPVGARGYAPMVAPVGPYGYSQSAYGYGVSFVVGRSWYGRVFPSLTLGRSFGRGRGRFGRW